jgi:hypothetical protein
MRPGLSPDLLAIVRQQALSLAQVTGAVSHDVAWLISPDDETLQAYQSERREAADSDMVRAGADLDRDIVCLREGWRPRPEGLADAPTLAVERIVIVMSPELVGVILRGSALGPGGGLLSRDRMTSLVVAVDAVEGRWARTLNRFYRLAHVPEHGNEGDGP